jgi:hypothetical protein
LKVEDFFDFIFNLEWEMNVVEHSNQQSYRIYHHLGNAMYRLYLWTLLTIFQL